jgi:hypothetical protein
LYLDSWSRRGSRGALTCGGREGASRDDEGEPVRRPAIESTTGVRRLVTTHRWKLTFRFLNFPTPQDPVSGGRQELITGYQQHICVQLAECGLLVWFLYGLQV